MRVGIIGLGDICQKAYLPIITLKDNIELIFCTRNKETLKALSEKYKIKESVTNFKDLIDKNIDCAFVHSSTESHYEICKFLLENGIHVYVDKPIAYHLSYIGELEDLAKKNNLILRVGFNRRTAPMVLKLKELGEANIVLIEKNRVNLPADPRVFIFDDFIHVVDTLRFLVGADYDKLTVDYRMDGTLLQSVVIKLSNKTVTGIGIMNRTNGASEEIMEYMAPGKKGVLRNLTHLTLFENNTIITKEFGDWENTLYKRGFNNVINMFLDDVKSKSINFTSLNDSIETHKLCEEIINRIIKKGL